MSVSSTGDNSIDPWASAVDAAAPAGAGEADAAPPGAGAAAARAAFPAVDGEVLAASMLDRPLSGAGSAIQAAFQGLLAPGGGAPRATAKPDPKLAAEFKTFLGAMEKAGMIPRLRAAAGGADDLGAQLGVRRPGGAGGQADAIGALVGAFGTPAQRALWNDAGAPANLEAGKGAVQAAILGVPGDASLPQGPERSSRTAETSATIASSSSTRRGSASRRAAPTARKTGAPRRICGSIRSPGGGGGAVSRSAARRERAGKLGREVVGAVAILGRGPQPLRAYVTAASASAGRGCVLRHIRAGSAPAGRRCALARVGGGLRRTSPALTADERFAGQIARRGKSWAYPSLISSQNAWSFSRRTGSCSFCSAPTSIWRIRSRETLKIWPTSSRV
jgi:hypothetical protein